MNLRVRTANYRSLKKVAWEPSGVCAVVGPNGSGKTTLLSVANFLKNAYQRTIVDAVGFIGGNWGLRTLDAPPNEPVQLQFQAGSVAWEIELATSGASVDERSGERVLIGDEVFLRRAPFAETFEFDKQTYPCDERTCLKVAYERTRDPRLEPLVGALQGIRFYDNYHISQIRKQGSQTGADSHLHPTGSNLFNVLRNWRDRREWRRQYSFVTETLRAAFPDIFSGLEFHMSGLTVSGEFLHPSYQEAIPFHAAPNGLLIGLLHLTAVAGIPKGGFVAIDEVENSLHPFAIRQLIQAFRDWSEESEITIALATHSPVVLDEFDIDPDRMFVMQPDRPSRPCRVTELADREWLGQFTLGRLYSGGDVGSPTASIPTSNGSPSK